MEQELDVDLDDMRDPQHDDFWPGPDIRHLRGYRHVETVQLTGEYL